MYKVPGAGGVVGGGAGLAATGADLTWWIAFGIVLVVAGVFLLRTLRGRRPFAADPADGARP
ncbi:MAG TPA: peptidase [Pseudonocardiaceae bacterium]